MRNYTKRRQIILKDSRQITTPDELREGMRIGVAAVLEPTSPGHRAAQALAALTLSYGRQKDQSRLTAAWQGWQHKGAHGLLPQWYGVVENLKDGNGVWVDLKGVQPEAASAFDHINQDPDALPAINAAGWRYTRFDSVGLVAVAADNLEFGEEAGRWMPAVTLCLDQA